MGSLKVGILGTGNIGTDLLIKIERSKHLSCACFSGKNMKSPGMIKAKSMGVNVSDKSVDAFSGVKNECELVFDATSAFHHYRHARIFNMLGLKVIDMTPAHIGAFCVPPINGDIVFTEPNVNMVTCGGQASIPMVNALTSVFTDVTRVDVSSIVSADSIGPATIENIDKYYSSTAQAITEFCGVRHVNVELHMNNSDEKTDMLTRIRAYTRSPGNLHLLRALHKMTKKVQEYVPGYQLVGMPRYSEGYVDLLVKVRGLGDWVPPHAGNLDIINCAAIAIAEEYAQQSVTEGSVSRLNQLFAGLYS